MPVFVQWKWLEQTKSLLTIFHFHDDFSERNLRLMNLDYYSMHCYSPEEELNLTKDWISWAPSHLDMALLMQLLCYANIINGLKPSKKKKLWFELEGRGDMYRYDKAFSKFAEPQRIGKMIGNDKKVIQYSDLRAPQSVLDVYTCIELCPEYIDYLKKILKPYLKD